MIQGRFDSMADAACARDKVVAALEKAGGKVVGYKAALTAKAVQARFKTDAPLYGVLTDRMMVADGAKVPAAFGAGPDSQGDGVSPQAETTAQTVTPEGPLLYLFGQQASPAQTTTSITRDRTDADAVARDLASGGAGNAVSTDAAAIAARQRPTQPQGPR